MHCNISKTITNFISMAPILIDNRGLIKLGLISVLITVIVFATGFFSGYQRASTIYQAGSEIEALSLPEKIIVVESEIEPLSPETIQAGEEIDVDQPALPAQLLEQTQTVVKDSTKNNLDILSSLQPEQQMTKLKDDVVADLPMPADNNNDLIKNKGITETIQTKSSLATDAVAHKPPVGVTLLTADELNKIKYSIQVGMYGRLVNAENMMKMLQVKHFDAYVSDYTNKKNEIRYNVRFGYFPDKKSALAGLKKYKNSQKSDGYLVKFSVENITNLAGTEVINEHLNQTNTLEKTDNKLVPQTVPTEATPNKIPQDKMVQADMEAPSNLLINNQQEVLADIQTQINTN